MKRKVVSTPLFWLLVIGLLSTLPILAACECGTTPASTTSSETTPTTTLLQPGPLEVFITGNGFVPATLMVPKGSRVTWINKDSTWRAVGSRPPTGESSFVYPYGESERIQPGESYSRTFDIPGVWEYYCPKTEQWGDVIVEAVE